MPTIRVSGNQTQVLNVQDQLSTTVANYDLIGTGGLTNGAKKVILMTSDTGHVWRVRWSTSGTPPTDAPVVSTASTYAKEVMAAGAPTMVVIDVSGTDDFITDLSMIAAGTTQVSILCYA